MNKKNVIVFSLIIVLFSFILVLGLVSAYRGDVMQTGPNYDPEIHNEIQQAIENNDYQKWSLLISSKNNNSRILEYVNKDNFDLFSAAYLEAKNGNYQELIDFRESIGLGLGNKYRQNNLSHRQNHFNKSNNN
jgi:uncharacterized membrane protein YvbJ